MREEISELKRHKMSKFQHFIVANEYIIIIHVQIFKLMRERFLLTSKKNVIRRWIRILLDDHREKVFDI